MMSLCFFIEPFSVPLYTTMGTNWSPAAVIVSALVAHFVLFVVLQMRSVLGGP